MSSIKFTPIRPRQSNDRFNQNILLSNSNINDKFKNYYSDKSNLNQQNSINYQNPFKQNNNNYLKSNKINYEYNLDNLNEINDLNPYYILITNFDNYTKELLNNFIAQQGIISRNLKNIGNDKIIIKFQNQRSRNEFIKNYEKVQDSFYGVRIKFIDEKEKEIIINNNANRIIHNICYNNNYMNNDINMSQWPEYKSNFNKFLDIFLNL